MLSGNESDKEGRIVTMIPSGKEVPGIIRGHDSGGASVEQVQTPPPNSASPASSPPVGCELSALDTFDPITLKAAILWAAGAIATFHLAYSFSKLNCLMFAYLF